MAEKVGRNAPCPCGSGRKFKRCCLDRPPEAPPPRPESARDRRRRYHSFVATAALFQTTFLDRVLGPRSDDPPPGEMEERR